MSDLAVRTRGLTKRFSSGQVAVDQIDLQVPRGAVYGFLGPNGSGKTTTLRMLLGLVQPTSGEVELLGQAMPQAAAQVLGPVGALVEGPAFWPHLTGRGNLVRLDACDPSADPATRATRADAALARVGLLAAATKKYRQYSLGMKQRLALAATLLRPRELMVLDEPTNGLDPQGTREVRTLVRELAEEGTTVLVSSHLLAEIDQVCTHLGVMSTGRLVLQGTRADLAGGRPRQLEVTTAPAHVDQARQVLADLGLGDVHDDGATRLCATLEGVATAAVTQALVTAGVGVEGLHVREPSLEELFVELTGEGFDVAH
ncbi:MAG: ABC transporter ATP-binding protein [Micrococcales bacterium]|nr:ABC transporter ATP-binding protein [Micrococcales bacterium]MCL2666627.1 ABC transporter ATP-binding protein [Micrococcales bacterium]